MNMAKKWVYMFKEGDAGMRNLLGGKGANLAEMTNIGLPVPQGFTITTEACTQYYEDGREINDEIQAQISTEKLYSSNSRMMMSTSMGYTTVNLNFAKGEVPDFVKKDLGIE